ncbi:hypothetical protein CEE37_14860 [candidate division LCP-89 bacterium B3_LCP]|uniref:Uncharacterized protein n=1 Tax=candidate division LCP-89 bacterium B3_LCP TaxID=2012998 RepID=A0A532UPN7_UNCL8|nr:MAG: hypothetical protein CEE37_14860 [candidate division LCP-89 bacterium B3_LCP]
MKSRLKLTMGTVVLTAFVISIALMKIGFADNPENGNGSVQISQTSTDILLLADASQDSEGRSSDLSAIYAELRELTKKYRHAKERSSKERIRVRTEELMNHLFNAKVQHDRKRLQVLEEKVRKVRERLTELQSHKSDLVHKGVQRALDSGTLPDWAPDQE